MVRLTLTRAEWLALAHELGAPHRTLAPPGLLERVRALLREAPAEWPDQRYTVELDATCADAARAALAVVTGCHPGTDQRGATLAEAEAIVRDHQRRI